MTWGNCTGRTRWGLWAAVRRTSVGPGQQVGAPPRGEVPGAQIRRCWIALGVILLGAAAIRFYGLGARSLWLDEALSWRLQSFPPTEIVGRTGEAATVHPPLYFLLLHYWVRALGDSELALRSLGALAGVATVWGMFFLAREAVRLPGAGRAAPGVEGGTVAGLTAALLAAISPFHVYAARQVRGYTLGMLLFVLSSWALLRMLGAQSKKAAAISAAGYLLLALAFCYTHTLGVFSIAAQGLFAICYLGSRPRSPCAAQGLAEPPRDEPSSVGGVRRARSPALIRFVRGSALAAGLLVLAGYAPWIERVRAQSENWRTSWTRPFTVNAVAEQSFAALLGTPDGAPVEPRILAWTVALVLLGVLLLAAVVGGPGGIFLFLAGTIPLLLNVIYSMNSPRSIFIARYLAFAQPAWLGACAVAVSRIPRHPERALVAGLLVLWSGFGWGEYWSGLSPVAKPGMRAAAVYLGERHGVGEPVLAQTPWLYFKLAYYLPADIPVRLCVAAVDRGSHFGSAHLKASDLITLDEVLADAPRRLWIVTSDCYRFMGSRYPDIVLPPNWRMAESRDFDQDIRWETPIRVICFVNTANESRDPGRAGPPDGSHDSGLVRCPI